MHRTIILSCLLLLIVIGCAGRRHKAVPDADKTSYVYIPPGKRDIPPPPKKKLDEVVTELAVETVVEDHQKPRPDSVKPRGNDAPAGTAEALGFYYIKPRKLSREEREKLAAPEVMLTPLTPQHNGLVGTLQYGKASYYADKFQGRKTASGELYDRNKLTAAHRTLPFGTVCKVTNLNNNRSVIVKINDRGPFATSRIIDLSYRAMQQLDGISDGIIDVKVEVIR